jgi:hypothetical protein
MQIEIAGQKKVGQDQVELKYFMSASVKIKFLIISFPLLYLLFFQVPCGIAMDSERNNGNNVNTESEMSPLLDLFYKKREDISSAVSRGDYPESVAIESENIWFSLQKYLIANNARIETLKLEARKYKGERREEVLDQLVEAGAERERKIIEYIRNLDKLTGSGNSPSKISRDAKEFSEKEIPDKESDSTKAKILDIEVEFKPEDIIEEEQVLE